MQSIIVKTPSDLTVDWAQRVVNQHDSSIVVSKVAVVDVDVGTTTRIRLKVEHDAPQLIPEQWFVKLPSLSWQAKLITALPRLLHTEVRFYSEVTRPKALTIPALLAGQSQLGKGAVLVLSDITSTDAVPGNPRDALSLEQATAVVKQLAHFHAHYWDKPDYKQQYHWLAGSVRRVEDFLGSLLAVPLMQRGLKKAADLVPKTLHAQALYYAQHRSKAMRILMGNTQTMVHHDCHPGNLFWEQSKPGLLDWQLVRFGEGISDIAYFMATSLQPELRRSHERALVNLYTDCLQKEGVTGLDAEQLFERYRTHLVYPFEAMLVTLAIGGMMHLESNQELIRRTVAAVVDLDAFSALNKLYL